MTDKPVLRGVADALQPMLDEISKIGKSVTEFANGPGGQALKAFAKARSAPMTDQPATHTLAEAEPVDFLIVGRLRLLLRERREALEEVDRLLDVEHAAALLLDACDAREAAGMTTGAAEVRQFLRDVRRTT